MLRLRYRDSWERPSLMVPGEVYAITIELFPIGNLFMPGHRLRLDISSSNFPHFDVNPNSGEPEGSMEHPRIAGNRVFVDRGRPSHILLPVIPLGSRVRLRCGSACTTDNLAPNRGGGRVMRRAIAAGGGSLAAGAGWTAARAAGRETRRTIVCWRAGGAAGQALGNSFHRGCVGVAAFPMGVTSTAAPRAGLLERTLQKRQKLRRADRARTQKSGGRGRLPGAAGTGKECFKKF